MELNARDRDAWGSAGRKVESGVRNSALRTGNAGGGLGPRAGTLCVRADQKAARARLPAPHELFRQAPRWGNRFAPGRRGRRPM